MQTAMLAVANTSGLVGCCNSGPVLQIGCCDRWRHRIGHVRNLRSRYVIAIADLAYRTRHDGSYLGLNLPPDTVDN